MENVYVKLQAWKNNIILSRTRMGLADDVNIDEGVNCCNPTLIRKMMKMLKMQNNHKFKWSKTANLNLLGDQQSFTD